MYETLLFVHVITAIAWVGSGLSFHVLGLRARTGEPFGRPVIARQAEMLSSFYPVMAVLVLLSGIGLVLVVDGYGFTTPWIVVALVGWLASSVYGGTVISRRAAAHATAFDERGAADPATVAAADAFFSAASLDLIILVVVVADMTIKPTFGL